MLRFYTLNLYFINSFWNIMGFVIKKNIKFTKYKKIYLFVILSFTLKTGKIKITLILIWMPNIAKELIVFNQLKFRL